MDRPTETGLHESPFEEPSRSVSVTKKVPKASSIVEASLEKTVYCYVSEYNAKFGHRIHKGFGKVTFELQYLLDKNDQLTRRN
ncbi:hypothetical protein ACQV2R_01570 [Facklamia sp. P12937]